MPAAPLRRRSPCCLLRRINTAARVRRYAVSAVPPASSRLPARGAPVLARPSGRFSRRLDVGTRRFESDNPTALQLLDRCPCGFERNAAFRCDARDRPRTVDEKQNVEERLVALRIRVEVDVDTEARAEDFTLVVVDRHDVR